jgi:hypothetical protein
MARIIFLNLEKKEINPLHIRGRFEFQKVSSLRLPFPKSMLGLRARISKRYQKRHYQLVI